MTINWSWSSTGNEVVNEYAGKVVGRTFLITGPSDGGIGAETALCLASGRPSTIILAGRDRAKIQPVINKISRISPEINTIFVALDLSDQASVRTAAAEVSKQVGHIDVLINNAAIMACPYSLTKDNFEVQFGTNFLGPFLFTGLLLPKLQAAGLGARIVNLSSSAHRFEGIRFDDIDFESGHAYDTWKAYGQSKTALILMAIYIADKVPNNEISTFSVHPGSIASNLQRHVDIGSISDAMVKSQNIIDFELTERKNLQQGCATTLIAALDPSLEDFSGSYLSDGQLKRQADHACGVENSQKLWHLGEHLLGERFDL